MQMSDWLGLGAIVFGGGGIFGAIAVMGKAWLDKQGKANEAYWTNQTAELKSEKEENASLRKQVATLTKELAEKMAQIVVYEATVKRLRRQRNALIQRLQGLGEKIFGAGLMEISEELELEDADRAVSGVGEVPDE